MILKTEDMTSPMAWIVPDLLNAPTSLSDITIRRSTIDWEKFTLL